MGDIPIIDLKSINAGQRGQEISAAIVEALGQSGFFYVQNHGVSEGLVLEMKELAKAFFNQPEAEKLKFRMENSGIHWRGYFPLGAELTAGIPDQKEGFYFGSELPLNHSLVLAKTPMHGPNQWPNQRMKKAVTAYCQCVSKLAQTLLELIAVGLGLESDYFSNRYQDQPTELFRIFCYPAATGDWGVREHTDMGFLTILLQDHLGGLQVKAPSGWVDAPPIENTLIVNIGDMLELWTHGTLKATLHRVRNSANENRYSFPFFFDPSWHSTLERIPQEMMESKIMASRPQGAEARWDALDLHKLDKSTTYGDFVWNKISKVFPQLAGK